MSTKRPPACFASRPPVRRSAPPRVLVTLALVVPFGLVGCSSADAPASAPGSSLVRPSPTVPSLVSTPSTGPTEPTPEAVRPFGPACSTILATGSGSLDQLSGDQVADALAKSPVLTRLGTALEQAGLVDVLNSTDGVTVFAPDDDAFSRLGRADAARLLSDRALLVKVLKTHVVEGRLSPAELGGSHQTLSGATVQVTGSGTDFTVDGDAKVVCGDLQAKNAIIYVVDHVLMPD